MALATLWAVLGTFGPIRADDLEGVIESTLAANPELVTQRAKLAAIREEETRARAGWRPIVSATADLGPNRMANFYEQELFDAEKTEQLRDYRLKLVQPLYRGGRTMYATRAARSAVAAEDARTKAAEDSVVLAAARSYLGVFRDGAIVLLRDATEQNLREQLRLTEAAFDAEAVTMTDVTQARARWFGASVMHRRALAMLNHSQEEFHRVVGRPAGDLADPAGAIEAMSRRLQSGECEAGNSPELAAARQDEQQQYYRVREVRAKALPSVDLELSVNRITGNALSSDFLVVPLRTEGASAILKVNIPLYQAGLVSSELRAARQAATAARANIESVRNNVTAEMNGYLETWRSLRDELTLLERQVSELRAALAGVSAEQQLGGRTVLEVLNAREELAAAQIAVFESSHDVALAVVQAAKVSGCRWSTGSP